MLLDAVQTCLVRDLEGFAAEVRAFPDDPSLWVLPTGVRNSTGTLVLHCCGNLRHFIGAVLGATGYVRDRDAEFATRDRPRAELEMLLAITRDEVSRTLESLDEATMPPILPVAVAGIKPPTSRFLVHLVSHTCYHLGQADYHRRMVLGDEHAVGAVPIPPLEGPARL
jgi:hypothetical protein